MELNLAEFDMDKHNLCGLLENLRFVPNLMKLRLKLSGWKTSRSRRFLYSQSNYSRWISAQDSQGTDPVWSMPDSSSSHNARTDFSRDVVLTRARGDNRGRWKYCKSWENGSAFWRLKKMLPLRRLTVSDFNVRGSLAPFMKRFCFLPNLGELHPGGFRGKLNMDEHNLCALLASWRFLPHLKVLRVAGRPQGN